MQCTEDKHISLDLDALDLVLQYLAPSDDEWERVGYSAARPKEDLHACSLVCRSWYSFSRRHIFRNVLYTFTPGELGLSLDTLEIRRWRSVVRRTDRWQEWVNMWEPRKTLPNLVEFLRDRPERAAQIQRLSLRCFPHDVRLEANDHFRASIRRYYDCQTQFILPSLLFSVLQALPHLRTLRLRDIFLQNSDPDSVPDPSDSPLISLKQLSISYPLAGTYPDYHKFPPILPTLGRWVKTKALQITAAGLKASRVDMNDSLFAQLNTLVLDNVPCATRLPKHFIGLNVRNLALKLRKSAELSTYNRYFRDMGHTLQHLRIQASRADIRYTLDISPCTNLETFALDFPESLWKSPSAAWGLVTAAVSSMTGLQKLCDFKLYVRMPPVEIYNDDVAELDPSCLCSTMNARLAACIRKLRLPPLVVVYYTSPRAREDPYAWPRAFLKKIFSVLDEQKLLRLKLGKKGSSWLIDPDANRPLPHEQYHWW